MLAYVFWHWRPRDGAAEAYEAALLAFHRSLDASPPGGFAGSAAFAVTGAPWIPAGHAGYEDWYLVDDWSAIGRLNRDAVRAPHTDPHDAIAQATAAGAGAVYELRGGRPALGTVAAATWIAKDRGHGYGDFLAAYPAAAGQSLWRRQLVLGPAPEFCRLESGGRPPAGPGRELATALTPLWATV